MALRLRRGTDLERQSIVFEEGELVLVTDTQQLYAGDGATPGGYLVSNIGSPSELTQNLDLNSFDISGSGTISATAFVGDGSGLTNLSISGDIVAGGSYQINIVSDDSAVLVNSETGEITGKFFGDGSNITDIALEQLDDVSVFIPQDGDVLTYSSGEWTNSPAGGIVEGSDYAINIVGADSSLIVDTETNSINTLLLTSTEILVNANSFESSAILSLNSDNEGSIIFLKTVSDSDLSENSMINGRIFFGRSDSNGELVNSLIFSNKDGLYIGSDSTGVLTESNYVSLTDIGLAIGKFSADSKLDVNGNAIIRGNAVFEGDVTASAFKGTLTADNSSIIIDATTSGLMVANIDIIGEAANSPVAPGTVDSWLEVTVNGATKYIPLYI